MRWPAAEAIPEATGDRTALVRRQALAMPQSGYPRALTVAVAKLIEGAFEKARHLPAILNRHR